MNVRSPVHAEPGHDEKGLNGILASTKLDWTRKGTRLCGLLKRPQKPAGALPLLREKPPFICRQAATPGPAPGAFSFDPDPFLAAGPTAASPTAASPSPPDGPAHSPAAILARRFLSGEIAPFTALSRYEAPLERSYGNAWRDVGSDRLRSSTQTPKRSPDSSTIPGQAITQPPPRTRPHHPAAGPDSSLLPTVNNRTQSQNRTPPSRRVLWSPANPSATSISHSHPPLSAPQSTPKSDTTPAPASPPPAPRKPGRAPDTRDLAPGT